MKKTLCALVALAWLAAAHAQNAAAYFMEGSPQRSLLNAALAPERGYVSVPALGSLSLSLNGNLSLDRLLFPLDGRLVTLFDARVEADRALEGLHRDGNLFGTDNRIELIGFGAYARNGRNFWSVEVSARTRTEARLPYEAFEFMKKGQSIAIGEASVASDSWLEAGFSYSLPLGRRVRFGLRAKALFGLARARARIERFDVTLGEQSWSALASGSMDIFAAGLEVGTKPAEGGKTVYDFDRTDFRFEGPSGYGFAIDAGVVYEPLPGLELSLAFNDLGMIAWSKDAGLSGSIDRELTFEGVEIDSEGTTKADFDLGDLQFDRRPAAALMRMLRGSASLGAGYRLFDRKLGFGLLYDVRSFEYDTCHTLTASVNYDPAHWFTLTGAFSAGTNTHALTLALNLHPGWINLFVATDMLAVRHTPQFIPVSRQVMNFTFGLGVPIGRRSVRHLLANRL